MLMQSLTARASAYWRLMRADRPIGTLLLLWPTLTALLIAGAGNPPVKILILFILGVWLMRSAGCVINDYADRHIDGHVSRTKLRPLARAEVHSWEALVLFTGLLMVALVVVLQLNKSTLYMSFIAVALAVIYPFSKRFTQLPQVLLGAAFSIGILMAFTALEQGLPLPAWLLFFANLSWTVAYDTEYAMADRDDDRQLGVKSTAILFGHYDRLAIAILQTITLLLLLSLGLLLNASWPYYLSLLIIIGLFAWQHRLLWQRQPQQCFAAFIHNNHVGWVLTVAVAIEFWFMR